MNRNELVVSHMWLAESLAKKYPYLNHEDAKQNGYMGLLVAADRYDEERGLAFSTYAYSYVKKYILKGAKDELTKMISLDAGDFPEQTVDESVGELVSRLFSCLPNDDRWLIIRRYIHGISVSQLAQELDVSQPAVSQRIKRILKKMRRAVDEL
jgi:RNA polymerase sigma factor (sigma-70 family)